MVNNRVALGFVEEFESICYNTSDSTEEKYQQLRALLDKICKSLTQSESVQFSGLFSRLSFVCNKYHITADIQGLRVAANKILVENYRPSEELYAYHSSLLGRLLKDVYGVEVDSELIQGVRPNKDKGSLKRTRFREAKVSVVEIQDKELICQLDITSNKEELDCFEANTLVRVQAQEGFSEGLFASFDYFWVGAVLYLVDIDVDTDGVFCPKIIVLEPDYLLDVSAVAECLQDYGHSELFFLKSKFESVANSKHILLGNYANLVVDELFSAQETIDFSDTFIQHFKANPLAYTTCKDIAKASDFRDYCLDSARHFDKIKQLIQDDFTAIDIDVDNVSLEPSFLSEKYGIQGRMDMLDWRKGTDLSKVVELKSGRPPFPDDGAGVKESHQAQLFMYYLLYSQVENISLDKLNRKVQGYVMYSKPEKDNLRGIAVYLKEFQKVINLRNRIIAQEYRLLKDDEELTISLLEKINSENLINKHINLNFRRLLEPQIESFFERIGRASALERAYFASFVNYIAYEHFLSKVGGADRDVHQQGISKLWLDSFEEKKDKFEILYDLVIVANAIDREEKSIIFKRTNLANNHTNFRSGDLCLLYPRNVEGDVVSKSQVFKCTIKEINKERVVVVFKYKQRNTQYFDSFGTDGLWALEADAMDSSFYAMYRNMYSFLGLRQTFKDLILTQKKPTSRKNYGYKNDSLSFEQQEVINKALSADDYFLLNGPPGTGKTSIIVKNLVQELVKMKKNILILAYTNRAVDELCDAVLEALGEKDGNHFIRFGNSLSCGEKHMANLLNTVIEQENKSLEDSGRRFTRADVRALLERYQVYIATAASMNGKEQVYAIKKFDNIIVDEASQILEPQLVGMLGYGDKFILIGDHKQLPAISLQPTERSKTTNVNLHRIGLMNRKNSLFERLYKFCEEENLEHAYASLTYQGRMHQQIAAFPNYAFYGGALFEAYHTPGLKKENQRLLSRQVSALPFKEVNKESGELGTLLSTERMIYFNNALAGKAYAKYNEYEADLVVRLIQEIYALYMRNGKVFDPKTTVGVIAPFRNQIALIKQKMEEAKLPFYDSITVDSVERFQGSQRDIIIYSFSINSTYQLESIISLNDEGDVDRKLNVALTRAREQLILIGNEKLLSRAPIYLQLIAHYKTEGTYVNRSIPDILAHHAVGLSDKLINTCEG